MSQNMANWTFESKNIPFLNMKFFDWPQKCCCCVALCTNSKSNLYMRWQLTENDQWRERIDVRHTTTFCVCVCHVYIATLRLQAISLEVKYWRKASALLIVGVVVAVAVYLQRNKTHSYIYIRIIGIEYYVKLMRNNTGNTDSYFSLVLALPLSQLSYKHSEVKHIQFCVIFFFYFLFVCLE